MYCGTKEQRAEIASLDGRIAELDRAIARDRGAIDAWNRDLPGYLNSFDEWLQLDKEAQRESVERGLKLAATLFLTDLRLKFRGREAIKQQELDLLWQRVRESPLNSPEFRELMKKSGGLVRDVREAVGQAEFAEFIEHAVEVAGAAHSASHGDYERAIVELLSLALHDPRAKVLVAEVDFSIAAIYANVADYVARKNVDELLRLGDRRLQAINSLSAVMSRHVNERKQLNVKRQAILSDT